MAEGTEVVGAGEIGKSRRLCFGVLNDPSIKNTPAIPSLHSNPTPRHIKNIIPHKPSPILIRVHRLPTPARAMLKSAPFQERQDLHNPLVLIRLVVNPEPLRGDSRNERVQARAGADERLDGAGEAVEPKVRAAVAAPKADALNVWGVGCDRGEKGRAASGESEEAEFGAACAEVGLYGWDGAPGIGVGGDGPSVRGVGGVGAFIRGFSVQGGQEVEAVEGRVRLECSEGDVRDINASNELHDRQARSEEGGEDGFRLDPQAARVDDAQLGAERGEFNDEGCQDPDPLHLVVIDEPCGYLEMFQGGEGVAATSSAEPHAVGAQKRSAGPNAAWMRRLVEFSPMNMRRYSSLETVRAISSRSASFSISSRGYGPLS
ncbi:hypothetical protein BDK51DRAFT_38269 [Blyttiomyces helicus]|uniref:Uncharacterized protein n=1 Tax=Blyttiomyces helicus TaxID=388810 RepID=A0A4V1IQK9_9FUNG|nr:hypothetical protein BDK51DRAFT_38269 [Blyttiomyces helicus]|eukprot:RKO86917.1 hypothetical protein BDK51DRAFT_38269 [Blyttiomyces helicus]